MTLAYSWARNIASVVSSHSGGATLLLLGFCQNLPFIEHSNVAEDASGVG